jgi:hypothetical protein
MTCGISPIGVRLRRFLAELAQHHAVGGVHAQRQLGAVVRQVADVRQVGVGHRQCDAPDRDRGGDQGERQAEAPAEQFQQEPLPERAAAARGRIRASRKKDRKP